ncbi:unnamed protein product [Urochloa humidicola]
MGLDHPERDSAVTHSLFDWLTTTDSDELQSYWIIHEMPRFIKCKGTDLKREFAGVNGIGSDLFDIVVRRIKQLDKYIYQTNIPLRWRHLLESDYAMHCLQKTNPIEVASIKEQFTGEVVDYELHRCRMIMVPINANGTWSCYVWDLRDHYVNIIDPSAGNVGDDFVLMLHYSAIKLMEQCLENSVRNLFSGWTLQFSQFEKRVVTISDSPCSRADSGFYTLFCMKNFDGTNKIHTSQAIIHKFKEYMLYEVFGLKENRGNRPSVYVETIDD